MCARPSLLLPLALAIAAPAAAQGEAAYLGPPLSYEAEAHEDPVARLAAKLAAGELELARDERLGLLPALLAALEVPHSSQALVFSKTSFQNALISPRNPRAIYFGDTAYVGAVPGSPVFELAGIDPERGPIFYTLTDDREAGPKLQRRDQECLRCHGIGWTDDWPGVLVRSVQPDREGTPIMRLGSKVTTHESPFAERWGGWYVTGTHGTARHLGNVALADQDTQVGIDGEAGANLVTLEGRCAIERHLTPHSDLVALMVLEHQTRAHNLLAQASGRARLVLHRQAAMNASLGRPPDELGDTARSQLKEIADELLRYLLFRDEPPLPAPIAGTSGFAADFAARGPRDRLGRSLRELDLEQRLFRWPASYLLQGESFRRLPAAVRDIVLVRMLRILQGRAGLRAYGHLSAPERRAILEILADTVPELPPEWALAAGRG